MSVELIAISQALSHCVDNANENKKVVICSDSKSALQHITGCASGRKGVSVAYKVLLQLNYLFDHDIDVRLQWVPSHIGLKGNEEADLLAKKAVSEGSEYDISPNYSELLPKYRKLCYDYWKEYFDERSLEKGIWYKAIQCEPPHIPWFGNLKLTRKLIVVAHRLRTGHMPLKKFAFLMRKVDTPNCDSCGVVEDVHHLLVECVRFERERQSLVMTYGLNRYDVGVFNKILAYPTSDAAKALFGAVSHLK